MESERQEGREIIKNGLAKNAERQMIEKGKRMKGYEVQSTIRRGGQVEPSKGGR
jgi:hypothetical protein